MAVRWVGNRRKFGSLKIFQGQMFIVYAKENEAVSWDGRNTFCLKEWSKDVPEVIKIPKMTHKALQGYHPESFCQPPNVVKRVHSCFVVKMANIGNEYS